MAEESVFQKEPDEANGADDGNDKKPLFYDQPLLEIVCVVGGQSDAPGRFDTSNHVNEIADHENYEELFVDGWNIMKNM